MSEETKWRKNGGETVTEISCSASEWIEYLRKYKKESVEVGDSEPDNTHTENHDVDEDHPRLEKSELSCWTKYADM